MRIKFCKECSALMYEKEEITIWLKCICCGYHEKKSQEWLDKELRIKMNQNENKSRRY